MGPGQKKLAKLLAPKPGQRSPEDIKKDIVVGMRKIDPSYKSPDEKKQLNNSGGRYPVYSQYSVKEDEELNKKVHTPEEIAKKHNKALSYITTQLKAGIKVEKEHTSKEDVARQIALAHLNEKPDYYVKLKKFVEDVGTGAMGAPANRTGMSVVGTGENQVHWSKRQPKIGPKGKRIKYGQPMLFKSFLRRKGMTNEQLKVWMKLHKEI